MGNTVISVENLSKSYRLGQVGTGTFSRDLEVWWAKVRGKPNPLLRIGEKDHGNRDGETLWALDDVSFTVEQGEVLGIIGRNGAGKSTLLKILSQVTVPTSGQVKVKGRIASLLEVGTGFHPDLTGRENIYLNGAILGMPTVEVRRKFDEIVAFAEVEKFIDTPVKRYSSGMYVRLAFAVAAHLEPEILVVDEVLAVGDAAFQTKCLGKMGEVAREGRTVLFVSHNMGAIQRLCQSALWLSTGRIEARGQVNDVVRSYLSAIDLQAQVFSVKYPNDDPSKPMQLLSANLREPVNGVFSVSDRLIFEMEVLSRAPVDGAYVTVNILDTYDSPLYWTADIDSMRFKNPTPGYSKLICICPAYLLTPGRYFANFAIVSLGRGAIDHIGERRITFDIEDNKSLLAVYGIRQPGVVAVPSEWSVHTLSTSHGVKDE